jgi:hypothetical protein
MVRSIIAEIGEEGLFFPGWNRKTEVVKKVGRKIRSLLRKLDLTYEEREQVFKEIMDRLVRLG